VTAPVGGNLQLSQGYQVLPPKGGQAYPIPCEEWDHLKERIAKVADQPWLFRALGSLFLGSALSTFVTILLGTFAEGSSSRVIAWAVVAVAAISGVLSLCFSGLQQRGRRGQISDVLVQMATIEKRYERRET
jgi:hypothetical protein